MSRFHRNGHGQFISLGVYFTDSEVPRFKVECKFVESIETKVSAQCCSCMQRLGLLLRKPDAQRLIADSDFHVGLLLLESDFSQTLIQEFAC